MTKNWKDLLKKTFTEDQIKKQDEWVKKQLQVESNG